MRTTTIRTLATAAVLTAVAATPAHAARATDPTAVTIANTAADPVPVVVQAPAGEQRVQVFRPILLPAGQTNTNKVIFEVPAGKVLTVERVSGQASTLSSGEAVAQIGARAVTMTLPLTPNLGQSGDQVRGAFNEELGLEVRGPADVLASINRFGPKPDFDVTVGWALLGTLADCPDCVAAG